MSRSTRLHLNVSGEQADDLRELARRRGTSVTNIVGRAVALYSFLDQEGVGKDGKSLQIVDQAAGEVLTVKLP